MVTVVVNLIVWFLVWVALSWPVTAAEIAVGVFVSAFVTYMTVDVFKRDSVSGVDDPARAQRSPTARLSGVWSAPVKIFWFAVYVFVFVWGCLRANIDVALRVLHPDVPIRPGTVRVKTTIRSDVGLTLLANSITLTPGTTTIDIDKQRGYLYVHQLCVRQGSEKADTLPVVTRFERILKRVFG